MKANSLHTFCIERDIEIWKKSSINILNYIEAERYILIVPDLQVEKFRKVTPLKFEIRPESEINKKINKEVILNLLPESLKDIPGWYLQQIMKIESILKSSSERIIIWDSDTIPLKKLNLFSTNGSPNYYVGNEYNEEYFNTNLKLIGLGKQIEYSFIAQVFPVIRTDITELIDKIEKMHNSVWYEAMIKSLSGNISQCFSEYELMGSFIVDKYTRKNINILSKHKWSRNGKRVFKTYDRINDVSLGKLGKKYDYIAIEGGLNQTLIEFITDKISARIFYIKLKSMFNNVKKN